MSTPWRSRQSWLGWHFITSTSVDILQHQHPDEVGNHDRVYILGITSTPWQCRHFITSTPWRGRHFITSTPSLVGTLALCTSTPRHRNTDRTTRGRITRGQTNRGRTFQDRTFVGSNVRGSTTARDRTHAKTASLLASVKMAFLLASVKTATLLASVAAYNIL
jgi:hypothetical protein